MRKPSSSLLLTEWFLFSTVLLLLISLVVTAKIQAFRLASSPLESPRLVELTILGHVAKPGCYRVEAGTPLSEAIEQARPKLNADLLRFASAERVDADGTFKIEEIKEISVFVEGACVPVELKLPPGSRLCDLRGLVELHSNADLSTFKKRRYLKNKEIVNISLNK